MKVTKQYLKKLIMEELTQEVSAPMEEARNEELENFLHSFYTYYEGRGAGGEFNTLQKILNSSADDSIARIILELIKEKFKNRESSVMKRAGYRE